MSSHTAAAISGLLIATGGIVAGWAIGGLTRRYRQGVRQLETLQRQLPQPYTAVLFQQRQLREIRSVLNDAHKMLCAVIKAPGKRPS